jgi:hypothetical protein
MAMPSMPGPSSNAIPPAVAPPVGAGAGAAAAAAGGGDTGGGAVGERGSDALASAAPQMIGDLASSGFGGFRIRSSRSTTTGGRTSVTYERVPLGARSGFKIAENESPRPLDRVFTTFNYFNGLNTYGAGRADLYRGVIGFEKTFLDRAASFGVRMPFTQGDGSGAIGLDGFGDVSLLGKFAFYNDSTTGDVVSGGLVVTVPTGYTTRLADGSKPDTVLLQPWAGFILNLDDAFTHGFTGVVIPTDSKDITLYTLDLGVGYRLYNSPEERFLTSIIPTFETHLNVALDGNKQSDLIYFPDSLFLTGGIHFGFFNQATLTLGAAFPITGPKINDFEFIAQFNLRF